MLRCVPRITSVRAAVLRGFTLLEILTVMGIILLLMTLTLWGAGGMRHAVKVKSAHADLTTLKAAIEKYKMVYGCLPDRVLPCPQGACANYEIIRLLSNWDIGRPLNDPGGRDRRFNYAPMLERLTGEQLDAQDNWRDPWGTPYAINLLPDDVWHIYQKMADAQAGYAPAPTEQERLKPYGGTTAHALYWVKRVGSQINVYSFGRDKTCDWGYCFGDGSGYLKGPWNYYADGDRDATSAAQRGDDIRVNGP